MDIKHKTNNTNQLRMAEHRRIHSEGRSAAVNGQSTNACPYDGAKRDTWINGYDQQTLLGQGFK